MKRLRRIIFNSLTVLSLLLCVWVSWLYSTDHIFERRPGRGTLHWHQKERIGLLFRQTIYEPYPGFEIVTRMSPVAVWVTMLLPGFWIGRELWSWKVFRSPIPKGFCPICNYDLRATPERCPECGTAMRLAN